MRLEQPTEDILDAIFGALWNRSTGPCNGVTFSNVQSLDQYGDNHILEGTIEWEGETYGFIIRSGNSNGTEVEEWGDPDDVGPWIDPRIEAAEEEDRIRQADEERRRKRRESVTPEQRYERNKRRREKRAERRRKAAEQFIKGLAEAFGSFARVDPEFGRVPIVRRTMDAAKTLEKSS